MTYPRTIKVLTLFSWKSRNSQFSYIINITTFYLVNVPAGNYMFKVNNRSTRARCKICPKLTVKTPKRRHWRRSGVLIVNFEHISLLVLDFEQINAGWDTQNFMYAQGRVFWAAVLKSYSFIKINTLEFV